MSTRFFPRRPALVEVLKFLTVGAGATIVALVGFNHLVHGLGPGSGRLHERPIEAYILANLLGGLVAYAGLRAWAFRERQVRGAVSGPVAFFSIGAATMVIPVICLAISRYLLRLDDPLSDNLSANVIGLGLGNLARWWAFRAFVFLAPEGRSA
ncbi:GtrA family protein [Nocardioides sp. AE5]|uniref:GtrA family protein n=1 Tax=Nocardioides sp. AE5 TaxID=2962573 RepID=UPI002881C5FD|nr:GtrA family protein [Nocardioides sp. AE5]MDT0201934.1 GtrA family protein [Nocardioides sp. AE5]